jgi:hypothetical protein
LITILVKAGPPAKPEEVDLEFEFEFDFEIRII